MPDVTRNASAHGVLRWLKHAYLRCIPSEIACFPPIDSDLADLRYVLRGKVLNAGAGWREVAHLVDGELTNQDIRWEGDTRKNIDIYSPLDVIPIASNYFDAILCIAVLEHVDNPDAVMKELHRVLKVGGHLILEVPFLQPEHKVPTDFQRYTRDGLEGLATKHGFRILRTKGLFTVYHTLYWQVHVWLHSKNTVPYLTARLFIPRILLWAARHSSTYNERLASGFQVLATKD